MKIINDGKNGDDIGGDICWWGVTLDAPPCQAADAARVQSQWEQKVKKQIDVDGQIFCQTSKK